MAPKSAKKSDATAKALKTAKVVKKAGAGKATKRKVRRSIRFRRPKTLRQKRCPKCPTKSVPSLPRMDHYKVIKSCVATESGLKKIVESNSLVFLCNTRANKHQIRAAVEALYDVKVQSVNTLIRPDGVKKAYVRLHPSHDAVEIANRIGII